MVKDSKLEEVQLGNASRAHLDQNHNHIAVDSSFSQLLLLKSLLYSRHDGLSKMKIKSRASMSED